MPASLIEAFGDCQSQNSSTSNMKKRKPKNQKYNQNQVSVSEYGHTIPERKYLDSSSPLSATANQRNQNQNNPPEMDPSHYNDDDQYLTINDSEYGPTDYNIKPSDVNDYNKYNQFEFDFAQQPEQITDSTNYIIDQSSVFRPQSQPQQPQQSQPQQQSQRNNSSTVEAMQPTQQVSQSSNTNDARIQELNNKIDLILQKLGHFEEPSQENIHDIILFVIFGLFVIFILDSVYRVGKMTI
jgi:hypothetical protein